MILIISNRTYQLFELSETSRYNDDHVSLTTVDDRVTAEYVTPVNEDGTPFADYWTDDWEKGEATLHKRDVTYYLHVAVEKEVGRYSNNEAAENGVVVGVDLNVDGYLVTSTGAFLGNADYLNHKRDEYERRRGNLQQTGTRSAHLTIKSIGSRFARWSADYLHRVSKALVREAIFLRGENPAVYDGSESDKSSSDHVLTLVGIFM